MYHVCTFTEQLKLLSHTPSILLDYLFFSLICLISHQCLFCLYFDLFFCYRIFSHEEFSYLPVHFQQHEKPHCRNLTIQRILVSFFSGEASKVDLNHLYYITHESGNTITLYFSYGHTFLFFFFLFYLSDLASFSVSFLE